MCYRDKIEYNNTAKSTILCLHKQDKIELKQSHKLFLGRSIGWAPQNSACAPQNRKNRHSKKVTIAGNQHPGNSNPGRHISLTILDHPSKRSASTGGSTLRPISIAFIRGAALFPGDAIHPAAFITLPQHWTWQQCDQRPTQPAAHGGWGERGKCGKGRGEGCGTFPRRKGMDSDRFYHSTHLTNRRPYVDKTLFYIQCYIEMACDM